MSLFERFQGTKEEGFREAFIKPLLVKMGFVNISNKHGSLEFGKDYVFSEIDRFMQYRHMVVQAKHEESINQGVKVDELLSQVGQAFNVPYHLPFASHEERRVSAVYVFNTGKITENAQTQIRHGLTDPAMRTNVHFFDGDHLVLLSNTLSHRYDETTRVRLLALHRQLNVNMQILTSINDGVQVGRPRDQRVWQACGPMLLGVEEYLSAPIASDYISVEEMGNFWSYCTLVKSLVSRHVGFPIPDPAYTKDVQGLKDTCAKALVVAASLSMQIDIALFNLPAVTL